jgi:hypothetical protein
MLGISSYSAIYSVLYLLNKPTSTVYLTILRKLHGRTAKECANDQTSHKERKERKLEGVAEDGNYSWPAIPPFATYIHHSWPPSQLTTLGPFLIIPTNDVYSPPKCDTNISAGNSGSSANQNASLSSTLSLEDSIVQQSSPFPLATR